MNIRIGYGFDVHQLKEGEDLILGGIKLPHVKGAVGHSDADVLIHVLCDAILGAANLRDIGYHFPDNSNKFKNIDSKILLKKVVEMITLKGFIINNIDSTICLQNPKIKSFIPEMIRVLANCMNINEDQISIKATTTEKLGYVGREEGISAHAVVLLKF